MPGDDGAPRSARSSGELYRLLVESAADYCIFTTDPDGRVLTWNTGAERLVGFLPREILGRSADVLFAPEDRRAGAPELERGLAARTGRAENERWHLRKDGERFWGAGIMIALQDQDGTLVGFAKILRDFTRRRELEQATLRQQRMESIGVLAGGVAHSFNNLLTGIMGHIELAARRPGIRTDPEATALVETALTSCVRAAELTRQLLAYSGRSRIEVRPLDLCREVQGVAAAIDASKPARIELITDIPESCPLIEGDATQVRQMLRHLLVNAIEAHGSGPGKVVVTARPEYLAADVAQASYAGFDLKPGRYVRIEVADTGPGMDERARTRAFEPFFTTKFPGRGLGLAEALGVVRSHGGAITLDSTPGAGTRFRVLLPAAGGGAAPEPPPPAFDPARPLVLVCDDEELIRTLVAAILEGEGFTVVQAENGQQALVMAERLGRELGIILLDLAMPVMGGEEALPRLRRHRPAVPIIAMTGLGEVDARERLREQGVDAFLSKPFTIDRLIDVVRSLAPSPRE